MKCWDCGAYKPTFAEGVGRCPERPNPDNHPDGGLVHGRSHGCSKRGSRKEFLRKWYIETIGYDPFVEDPKTTVEEIESIRKEYLEDSCRL